MGEGLEFGALSRPILRGPKARVFYVDHLDRDGLREKYAADPRVSVNAIVPVDIVWANGALRDAVQASLPGYERWFHYAVASHVIEHVPDIIRWLAELRSVLSAGATLRLSISDRRFTMDIERRESQLCDALAAYLHRVRVAQPREIIDFHHRFKRVDRVEAWRGHVFEPTRPGPSYQTQLGLTYAQGALAGEYHDVHCWVFTPASFVRLMVELCEFGMIWFECTRLYETAEGELDFLVHLTAATDAEAIVESWRQAERALTRTELGGRWLPQDELAVLRDVARAQAVQIEALTAQVAERYSVRGILRRGFGKAKG
jgi:hypothetical protein